MPQFEVIQGDCLDVLAAVPDAWFDSVVCDPPYALTAVSRNGSPRQNNPATPHGRTQLGGAGFMGKTWDAALPTTEMWVEILRTAKPGAHLVAFGGTRTYHRLTCAIEDAGWEIRDCLTWLYGSGFPKSHNGPWGGTALKPAWEPIILARKPLIGTVAANTTEHGTGALNIDGCRIEYQNEADKASATPQGKCTSKDKAAIGAEPDAGRGLERIEFERPEQKGRWPANVLLDEEASALLDGQSGTLKSGTAVGGLHRRSNKTSNCYGHFVGERVEGDVCYGDSGGASRFFYCGKASKKERGADNTHPTVKPISLMRWLCRLVTPPQGLILDPFMGSGSTGCAALLEGFRFTGIERESEYVEIARRRLEHWVEEGE